MKLSIAKRLTAGLLLSIASVFASAGLINIDPDDAGGFDAFKDDVSGLIWMDFNETTNISRSDISKLFDVNDKFHGWRLAEQSEIEKLVYNLDALDGVMDGEVARLENNVSVLFPIVGSGTSKAIINASRENNYFQVNNTRWKDEVKLTTWDTGDKSSSSYSNLLVKVEEVPEPTTLAIFGLGLAGLAFRRKGTKA